MKVRELTITDYRAFGGAHRFELSEHFTVIAGINGRGKTALLDGLALLVARLLRALTLMTGNQRTILASDVHGNAEAAILSMQVNCAGIPLTFEASYRPGRKRVMATRLPAATRESVVRAYGDPDRPDDQAPIAVYYTTDRAGFRLPRTLPTTVPQGREAAYTGALVNSMVDYRDFMARYRVWVAEGQRKTLGAFDRALRAFLAEFGEVEVQTDPVKFTIRKNGERLGLHQLSDGERAFIAVVADLVRRLTLANPDIDDPLRGSGVVLIDELELHLHPTWQRSVVNMLRKTFPKIQFVATTHSAFIVQSLKPGELINLDPDEFESEYSGKSIEDIAEHVMGVPTPQKSERYLQMVDVAEQYLRRARGARPASAQQAASLRAELDKLVEPYSDDPAYVALLRLEREKAIGGATNAPN